MRSADGFSRIVHLQQRNFVMTISTPIERHGVGARMSQVSILLYQCFGIRYQHRVYIHQTGQAFHTIDIVVILEVRVRTVSFNLAAFQSDHAHADASSPPSNSWIGAPGMMVEMACL